MEDDLRSTLDFEFGIVGDQLDLSDDEDLLSQVSVQASKLELQRQQEANFTAWSEDLADQFQHFLKELVGELQPRQEDYLARLNIVGRLSSALDDMDSFRGATLSTFGSFESNFYTRWSDLDLSLELPDRNTLLEPISKKLKVRVLNSLLRTLMRKGEAHNVQFIPYARVPLITFEDSWHNISCDISVDNDAAMLKSRFLRWIGEIDSRCRDLIFLVKCWAKAHGINDPKLGTLNSFALCLLAIFHLQTRSPPVLPPLNAVLDEDIARKLKGSANLTEEIPRSCWEKIQPFIVNQFGAQNKSSVAELFISFFNQFSAVKNLWTQGLAVCTFTGAWGDRSSTCGKWRTKRYMMAIEDPFDRWENCARSVSGSTFDSIIRAFTSTADTLQRPERNIGLSCLLEALFVWPVDAQALGRQAWLAKVHSKAGKRKLAPLNTSNMDGNTAGLSASRKLRGKAQHSRYHRPNNREILLDAYLENTLEAQFRGRLQLAPVKQKKKRRKKPPVTTKDLAVVGVGIPGSNLVQNSLHLERIDNRAQAIENHLHQLLNIPGDSVLEHTVEASVREQPVVNHSGIADMSKERKKKKGGPVSGMGAGNNLVLEDSAQSNLLYERTVSDNKKAQAAEHNPHHLHTEKNLYIEGVARTQKPKVVKDPQKGSWPALEREPSLSVSYSNNEVQLQGDLWPAIQSSTRDHPGTCSAVSSVLNTAQAHSPLIEKKSYASAMQNGGRQRSRFNQGGSMLRNDGTGILPRNKNGTPGMTVPAAKLVGDIPGRVTMPAAAVKSNHSMRQGEVRFQTEQQPHLAKVWAPKNMAEKYAKFSSVIKGQKDKTVAVGGSKSEPWPRYDKSTG